MRKFLLKVRRAEAPFYARLKGLILAFFYVRLPVPRFALPLFRFLYEFHLAARALLRRAYSFFYAEPLFRGRCEQMGKRVEIVCLPVVEGHTRIYIGNDVKIWGKIGITSGRILDNPTLRLGNRVTLGHQVQFTVNREIVLEDAVHVASHVTFADTDGHPRDPWLREAGFAAPAEDIRPIHVGRNAWIGHDSTIQKGVTIGESAIVGANSTVMTDIPAFAVAMGSPARVVIKDVRQRYQQPEAEGVTEGSQGVTKS